MNILQISAPKSGSYWLYRILLEILQKRGLCIRSFIKSQPVYNRARHLSLSFTGQAGVDMMDIEKEGCYYRISSFYREPIRNPEEYVRSSTIVWTHSSLCTTSLMVFPLFDKRVCIVRDPRDRALSSARFAFTPYMRQYYPTRYSSPEEYLDEEYERLLMQWVWYVGNYLLYKEKLDIHFVFYERLLHDFRQEFQALLDYLECPMKPDEKQEISEKVSFASMQEDDPDHLQNGRSGKWARQLSGAQKELALEKAGDLMRILNFPLEVGSPSGADHRADGMQLPLVPETIPCGKLNSLLSSLEWYGLFGEN